MRDIRSVANAFFCFFLFLLVYAYLVPGHARGKAAPHFLRMEIVSPSADSSGPDRVTFSVPFGLVHFGLRAAVGGRVRRELNSRFDESIDAENLRDLWKEVASKPEGTEVKRTFEETDWTFTKAHGIVSMTVEKPGLGTEGKATIRLPAILVERLADHDRRFNVDALLSELSTLASSSGSLLEVESDEGKVRVWIE